MFTTIHFFRAEGAPCGTTSARSWTLNREHVTCPACAAVLAEQEEEELGTSSHRAPLLGRTRMARA